MTVGSIVDDITFVCWVFGHGVHFLFDEKTQQQCATFSLQFLKDIAPL